MTKKIKQEEPINQFPENLYTTSTQPPQFQVYKTTGLPEKEFGDDVDDNWLGDATKKAANNFETIKINHFSETTKTEFEQINYSFNENEIIQEIQKYIDSTYNQHYGTGKYQATDLIIDSGHGLGFTLGNVIKYAKRYGKKQGYNREDLMKMIHYAILSLYVHDLNENNKGNNE